MKQHWWKLLLAVVVLVALVGMMMRTPEDAAVELLVRPQTGPFEVAVMTTGELKAQNSVRIMGPTGAQKLRIYDLKVTRLVEEGTVVSPGDFVAELDRSELTSKIQEEQTNLQKAESEFTQAMLDTTLELTQARDNLVDLQYSMEESKIKMEQSVYEPPSVKRQAQIDFEKAERSYNRAVSNYATEQRQAEAKMRAVEADLTIAQRKLDDLNAISAQFTVTAPDTGMVIYHRSWRGERVTSGSTVNAWDPVVATLPDLSVMESTTYVNEVDIQKIQAGQPVEISLDAMPDKSLTGTVARVANIGEQRPNSDSKVFEVTIRVTEQDSTLRPAMTTSNRIVVASADEALRVPLETLHVADSLNFVFKKDGRNLVRQEVVLGLRNDNEAIVEAGLTPDDQVFMSLPADTIGVPLRRLDRSAVLATNSDQR